MILSSSDFGCTIVGPYSDIRDVSLFFFLVYFFLPLSDVPSGTAVSVVLTSTSCDWSNYSDSGGHWFLTSNQMCRNIVVKALSKTPTSARNLRMKGCIIQT